MHPVHEADPRLSGGGYVPYFYERGLFHVYGRLPGRRAQPAYHDPRSYRFLSDSIAHPPSRDMPTVERIVARGYLVVPDADPTMALLSDKRQTSWLGLDDVITQIRRRYEAYEQNLYQIQLGKTAATNSLYAHWAYHGPPSARHFYSRHKRLQDLYQEEREERQSLWRDVSRLRLALPESAQSYLSAHRKLEALAYSPGDAW